jgi:hypothetical protein
MIRESAWGRVISRASWWRLLNHNDRTRLTSIGDSESGQDRRIDDVKDVSGALPIASELAHRSNNGSGQSGPASFVAVAAGLTPIADVGRARKLIPGGEHRGKAAGPHTPLARMSQHGPPPPGPCGRRRQTCTRSASTVVPPGRSSHPDQGRPRRQALVRGLGKRRLACVFLRWAMVSLS